MSSQNILRIVINNQIQDVALGELIALPAQQGAVYSVVDAETGLAVNDVVFSEQGDALVIQIDGEQVAEVDGFYDQGMQASVDMSMDATPQLVASHDAVVANSDVVWEASQDMGAVGEEAAGISTGELLGGALVVGGGLALANRSTGGGDAASAAPATPAFAGVTVTYDLTAGTLVTSDNSTSFLPGTDYQITIIVDAAAPGTYAVQNFTAMGGGANLGAGDSIRIVGQGGTSGEILLMSPAALTYINAGTGATPSHATAIVRKNTFTYAVGASVTGSTISAAVGPYGNLTRAWLATTTTSSVTKLTKSSLQAYAGPSILWAGTADFNPAGTGTSAGAVAFTFV